MDTPNLYYLSQSLLRMGACDVVYFRKGWENARGCKIEHEVSKLIVSIIIGWR